MGYADCGLVALSGAAALIAALVGDKFGIAKVCPIYPGVFVFFLIRETKR